MIIALLTVEMHVPGARSLKDKRMVLRRVKDRLKKFNVAVSEVDHHDLWQRSRLTVACVAREHRELETLLEEAVRYLNGQEYELVSVEREVVVPGE
jgi:uncharacterized protein YlxP (DUF503 family)